MSPLAIGSLAFCFVFGAACLGMLLHSRLPDGHLSGDSRDAIKLATAIIGTLSALALGLLIASSKRSLDDANIELRTWSARVVLLDRVMAHYGPETKEMRGELRTLVQERLRQITGGYNSPIPVADGLDVEEIQDGLRSLTPGSNAQRWLQTRALQLSGEIAEAHWLRPETESEEFPSLFVAFLVVWLALLFGSFGLLTPRNATVVFTLFICSLSITGALALIIDMDHPYLGFIRVSEGPLVAAIDRLGKP
ncbi:MULTISPECIES: DUF4239 domain-containing protein [unclassified Chelatococcus]|jgi:hypothetical protein|uniref:bestrophin-like domain n=1 Tax=unclassified Chelatococcus TaxID=2638111 RepID=UPI001BCDD109|nr:MULTISPECIES: DUF4239 domain-containing protein [unclassified Chelatococcus]CAH1657775.1 conserved membrane hypothetical protein [Hyphomicrobiales bacterium]MBS7742263.1 DUF4239 domain-containing protein [Chelatococcus sp. HY11]MBX3542619.1 DUF4239 domain-containing protein [Chelatococcus sp.]MCO5075164.1 DUF4239 domain-containing protein [Chelatococcus sp.]CAH1689339.1 conserved membrane hypothetical protein [Hyphomicrobiales bacterium]